MLEITFRRGTESCHSCAAGEVKDELAAAAVNHYSKEIGQLMERAAKEKGITMKLGEISVNL